MTTTNPSVMLAGRQLLAATGIALVIAMALLLTVVLPAEFGRDPTGIGGQLGLLKMADVSAAEKETPAAAAAPREPLMPISGPISVAEREVTLASRQGVEVKARMRAGESILFSWKSEGGVVHVDMHGEPLGAVNDEFTSFRRGKHQPGGDGLFTAPYDGTHGWYWMNANPHPGTVRVRVAGNFSELFIKQ